MQRLIAIDWGTSSLRGARVEAGNVAEECDFTRVVSLVQPRAGVAGPYAL